MAATEFSLLEGADRYSAIVDVGCLVCPSVRKTHFRVVNLSSGQQRNDALRKFRL